MRAIVAGRTTDQARRQTLAVLAAPLIAGFVMGWTGAGPLDALPRPIAATAGMLVALLGWLGAELGTMAAARALRPRGWPLPAVLAAGVVLSGPLAVPATFLVHELFGLGGLARLAAYSPGHAAESLIAPALLWVSVNMALVHAGIARFGYARAKPAPAPASGPIDDGEERLLALVRPAVRAPVIALQAEQHYVRVHTRRGEDLIHHRFGDAVRLMGGRGTQVHRSWWVAADAVDHAASAPQRLRLRDGRDIPVGRTFLLEARRLGA